uniref:Uncharacterized protein n=1 Tax=Papilio xuthus TaxID=66420 RepID=I4DLL7_PAPXU|nr:unknown unsecreted protein [Papilio xuthus]
MTQTTSGQGCRDRNLLTMRAVSSITDFCIGPLIQLCSESLSLLFSIYNICLIIYISSCLYYK